MIGVLKLFRYHGTSRLIDELFRINDKSERLTFFRKIYPKDLELKVKHQLKHATFSNLDSAIEDTISAYKLFYKRNKFPMLLFACFSYRVIIPLQFYMVQYFQGYLG